MNKSNLRSLPLVAALIGAGVVGGAAVEALHHAPPPVHAAVIPPLAPGETSRETGSTAMPDFPLITQKYGPAVVNISVSGTRKPGASDEDEDSAGGSGADPFEF